MILKLNNKFRIFSSILLIILEQPAKVRSFYTSSDGIIMLTDSNFDRIILHSSDVWVVEYFAPWCPFCKRFAPEMKTLARIKQNFQVAAIDADKNNLIGDRYKISRYPTIKIFGKNKRLPPKSYYGKMNANSIASAARVLFG